MKGGNFMFIWTIGDTIAIVIVAFFVITLSVGIATWVRQARCKHDGGVNESYECEAICLECGKNLGFIGTWLKNNGIQ